MHLNKPAGHGVFGVGQKCFTINLIELEPEQVGQWSSVPRARLMLKLPESGFQTLKGLWRSNSFQVKQNKRSEHYRLSERPIQNQRMK